MDDKDEWNDPTPVHSVAQDGSVERLKALVAAGVDVNAFDDLGYTPLHYAAMKGHEAAVSHLLGAGADVNAHDEMNIGNTPLGEVAGNCSLRMAQLLVNGGADPTIRGWMQLTALDLASKRERGDGPAVYRLLLSAKSPTTL